MLTYTITVCTAVCNQAKADNILTASLIKALNSEFWLIFIFVSDILADNVFDDIVKEIDSIIHVALLLLQDISSNKFETYLIQLTIKDTTEILFSAKSSSSVRYIVIIFSEAVIISWRFLLREKTDKIFTDLN